LSLRLTKARQHMLAQSRRSSSEEGLDARARVEDLGSGRIREVRRVAGAERASTVSSSASTFWLKVA
jgi:hypothetical protein